MKLNLGACDRAFPGFLSVDRVPPADFVADLAGPWPWETSSVDEIRAYDVLEHIRNCSHVNMRWCCMECGEMRAAMSFDVEHYMFGRLPKLPLPPMRAEDGKIHVMNEAWRVLRPGGLLDIEVPTTDGPGAWQDPTHVTYWHRQSFLYYTAGDPHRERFDKYYGVIARFKVLQSSPIKFLDGVTKLKISLEAVK